MGKLNLEFQRDIQICTFLYGDEKVLRQQASQRFKTEKDRLDITHVGHPSGCRYLTVSPKGNRLFIYIRGTANFKGVLHDGIIWKKKIKHDGISLRFQAGFYKLARKIARDVAITHKKDQKINIVGHSAGGAVACILGFLLEKGLGYEVESVRTFGAPMCASRATAQWLHHELKQKVERVYLTGDTVTKVPYIPFVGSYSHYGQDIKIERNDKAHSVEYNYFWNRTEASFFDLFKLDFVNDHAPLFYVRAINYLLQQVRG